MPHTNNFHYLTTEGNVDCYYSPFKDEGKCFWVVFGD